MLFPSYRPPRSVKAKEGSMSYVIICKHLFYLGRKAFEMIPDFDIFNKNLERFNDEQRYFKDASDAFGEYIKEYMNTVPKEERKRKLAELESMSDRKIMNYFRHPYTDLGNTRRIVDTYREAIRFCPDTKCWYHWNERYWEVDTTGHILHLIEKRITSLVAEIEDLHSKNAHASMALYPKLYRLAEMGTQNNQERRRINAAEELSRHQPELIIRNHEFDANKFLLNCSNGTLDLRTGELLTHCREKYITQITDVSYNAEAECPNWIEFLTEIMDGNNELVEYLQRIIGYCLTGNNSEQKIFIFHGTGSNGKSTFIETIQSLMADYSKATKFKTFTDKGDHALAILATLNKVRLVTASESRSEDALAEDLIKEITGGEAITAKALYKMPFTYHPQFKLILSSNNKPDIKHQDHGTWRRIRLVPFEVTIPEDQQNKDLPHLLRDELPGILAWAVRGAMAWWEDRQAGKEGLKTPDIVLQATEAYKEDMDVIGDFLRSKFVFYENYRVEEKQVFALYETWCADNKERYPYKKTNLYKMVEERGFKRKSANGKKWFIGLKPKMDIISEMGERYRQSRQ
jgi:putative DNA primase/helicase